MHIKGTVFSFLFKATHSPYTYAQDDANASQDKSVHHRFPPARAILWQHAFFFKLVKAPFVVPTATG